MMKALLWNILGIAGSESRRRLTNIIKDHKVCIAAIREPMIEHSRMQQIGRKIGLPNTSNKSTEDRSDHCKSGIG